MKYSIGDILYLGHATSRWEVIDVIGNLYYLQSLDEMDYKGKPREFQTAVENALNPRTIYERLEELENNAKA